MIASPGSMPGPTVEVDGQTLRGRQVSLKVIAPQDQDTVRMQITAEPASVYPMQPFQVALTIAVKSLPESLQEKNPVAVQSNPPALNIPWVEDKKLPDGLLPQTDLAHWLGPLENGGGGGFSVNDIGSASIFAMFEQRKIAFMPRPEKVRLPDKSFLSTYTKSIVSIGLMMIMVVVLGVVSGCFVKGPVATLLTAFVVIVGRVGHTFMQELTSGYLKDNPTQKLYGSGLFDSIYRIPTHLNQMIDLDDSFMTRVIKTLDSIELTGLWAVQHLFPDFGTFNAAEYTTNAFDVPWAESMLPSLALTAAYCVPWILVGYFSLKTRELEAK
jgi:hypothetical protein